MENPSCNENPDVIDRAWSLRQIGGDEDLFADIAHVFLTDSPELRQRLNADMAAGNLHTIHQTAHCIKSAVGNFGARRAMAAAQALETASRNEDSSALEALASALTQELIAVEEALRPFAS